MSLSKKAGNPIDVYVGLRVRAARLEKQMSQETLAQGLGLSFQQIQKYEKGGNRIGASRMQMIGRLLEKPVGWFFAGAPGSPDVDPSAAQARDLGAELFSTAYGAELAEHYLRIPHNVDRRVVVDVARALAERAIPVKRAAE